MNEAEYHQFLSANLKDRSLNNLYRLTFTGDTIKYEASLKNFLRSKEEYKEDRVFGEEVFGEIDNKLFYINVHKESKKMNKGCIKIKSVNINSEMLKELNRSHDSMGPTWELVNKRMRWFWCTQIVLFCIATLSFTVGFISFLSWIFDK